MCECRHDHPDPTKRLAIYSRIVGYYEPVQQWNKGKQAEFANRKTYKLSKATFTAEDAEERRGEQSEKT